MNATIQAIKLFPLNSTQPPIKQKHIGFFVKENIDGKNNDLFEITEDFYPHPDCDQNNPEILISKLDYRKVGRENKFAEGQIRLFKDLAASTRNMFSKIK